MPGTDSRDYILDQLAGLEEVESRARFGGFGLFCGETFFGIIHRAVLYFKTTPQTAAPYLEHGMKPLQPIAKQRLQHYYQVPPEVIESAGELALWARQSFALA